MASAKPITQRMCTSLSLPWVLEPSAWLKGQTTMGFRSASLATCHLKTFAFLVAPLAAPGLVLDIVLVMSLRSK